MVLGNTVGSEKEYFNMYMIDDLTGLPNVNYFTQAVNELIRKADHKGHTAFYLNLKDMSIVNERFGFEKGDEIICKFADFLGDIVIDGEFAARLGADNFIGVIYSENLEKFLRFLDAVYVPVFNGIEEEDYNILCNIGLYELTGEEKKASEVMERISIAFTMSRKENIRFAFYDEKVKKQLIDNMNYTRKLPKALKEHELVVYFQPKVSATNYNLVGAEALVRWQSQGQLIPPAEFIPICEKTGLVTEIDFYVLEETCKKMREWADNGYSLVRVSVNFSKQHFKDTNVAERIMSIIGKYDIPPEFLEIEFTETAYLDKEELLEITLGKLKQYGIASSIDDFGSGYSSLNLLQNMDFEVLKLDKSLLGKSVENSRSRKVISHIINMAKELEMEVLAEGVETIEEFGLLKELNCDIIQGYFFDRPLKAEDFETRLREGIYPNQRAIAQAM